VPVAIVYCMTNHSMMNSYDVSSHGAILIVLNYCNRN